MDYHGIAAKEAFLLEIPLLAGLSKEDLCSVASLLEPATYGAGDAIMEPGCGRDRLHFVERGQVAYEVQAPSGESMTMATHLPGDHFGEICKLLDLARDRGPSSRCGSAELAQKQPMGYLQARVKAVTEVKLQQLSKQRFMLLPPRVQAQLRLGMDHYKVVRGKEMFLERCDVLHAMDPEELWGVAELLHSKTFTAGEVLIPPGQRGQTLFFLEHGEVLVQKPVKEGVRELGRYQSGQMFGCITNIGSTSGEDDGVATIALGSKVRVHCLDRACYSLLPATTRRRLQQGMDTYDALCVRFELLVHVPAFAGMDREVLWDVAELMVPCSLEDGPLSDTMDMQHAPPFVLLAHGDIEARLPAYDLLVEHHKGAHVLEVCLEALGIIPSLELCSVGCAMLYCLPQAAWEHLTLEVQLAITKSNQGAKAAARRFASIRQLQGLENLSSSQMHALAAQLAECPIPEGGTLPCLPAQHLMWLVSGAASCGPSGLCIGEPFGEIDLAAFPCPARAHEDDTTAPGMEISAQAASVVYVLDEAGLLRLPQMVQEQLLLCMPRYAEIQRKSASIAMAFPDLAVGIRWRLALTLRPCSFPVDARIVTQGGMADCVVFLMEGSARVLSRAASMSIAAERPAEPAPEQASKHNKRRRSLQEIMFPVDVPGHLWNSHYVKDGLYRITVAASTPVQAELLRMEYLQELQGEPDVHAALTQLGYLK